MAHKLLIPAAKEVGNGSNDFPSIFDRGFSGRTMLHEGLLTLGYDQLSTFDEIVVIVSPNLMATEEAQSLSKHLSASLKNKVSVFRLEDATSSPMETLMQFIQAEDADHSFAVKDVDNAISLEKLSLLSGSNEILYGKIDDFSGEALAEKAYVDFDSSGFLRNIVEKRVISSFFFAGVASFASYSSFALAAKKVDSGSRGGFVSDVIRELLANSIDFTATPIDHYQDFGNVASWQKGQAGNEEVFLALDTFAFLPSYSSQIDDVQIDISAKTFLRAKKLSEEDSVNLKISSHWFSRSQEEELEQFLLRSGISCRAICEVLPYADKTFLTQTAKSFGPPKIQSVVID